MDALSMRYAGWQNLDKHQKVDLLYDTSSWIWKDQTTASPVAIFCFEVLGAISLHEEWLSGSVRSLKQAVISKISSTYPKPDSNSVF